MGNIFARECLWEKEREIEKVVPDEQASEWVWERERESRGKNVRQIIVKNGGKKERKKRELGRNWKEKQVGWWAVIYKVAKYGMFRAIISPSVSVEQRETEQFID